MTGSFTILPATSSVSPDLAANAGIEALKDGTEAEVLPRVEAAVRAFPAHPRLWQVIGLLHRALDEMEPALAALQRAASLAPGDASIAQGLAQATMEAGFPATRLFDHALRLDPTKADLLISRAAALTAEMGPEAVIPHAEAIVDAHPAWLPGQALLSRLRFVTGDRETFTAGYEKALAATPRDIKLWRDLINKHMHAAQFPEALDVVARGRAAMGPHPVLDLHEAICLDELGEVAAAGKLFSALGPANHINVAIRHVRHLLRARRADEAAALAEAWIKDPEADFIWPYISIAWRVTGDPRWQWLEGDERLIQHFDLLDQIPDLAVLAGLLRELHTATHQPLEQSVRGGTQTDFTLFRHIEPEIKALRAAIVGAVERYKAALPPVDPTHPFLSRRRDRPVRLSGSWSVRLPRQGHHSDHIHPQGWISSAFYVALPEEAERGPAPAGWIRFGAQSELNLDLAPTRMIEPKPGRLVLFPSIMWHGTVPFNEGERLTVAFDVARPI